MFSIIKYMYITDNSAMFHYVHPKLLNNLFFLIIIFVRTLPTTNFFYFFWAFLSGSRKEKWNRLLNYTFFWVQLEVFLSITINIYINISLVYRVLSFSSTHIYMYYKQKRLFSFTLWWCCTTMTHASIYLFVSVSFQFKLIN